MIRIQDFYAVVPNLRAVDQYRSVGAFVTGLKRLAVKCSHSCFCWIYSQEFSKDGLVNIVGGCCGTTPEHIRSSPSLKLNIFVRSFFIALER